MWFDKYKIEAIEQGLKSGNKAGLSGILPEKSSTYENPTPSTFCPKCGKAFIRKQLNYIRVVVPACPDGHGVLLHNSDMDKIRLMLKGGAVPSGTIHPKSDSFRVFVFLVGIALVFFNGFLHSQKSKTSRNYKMTYTMEHTQKVGPHYWPSRDFSQWNAFPVEQNAVVVPEELQYFKSWMDIVNGGIVNRLNMQDALLAKRPVTEYMDAYYFYSDRQEQIINRLKDLVPPERLGTFHDLVVDAAINQVEFYEDYARRKTDVPALEFNALMQHPKLIDCNAKLWDAFHEFERIYPNRDTATNNAIEQRLCWLDMI